MARPPKKVDWERADELCEMQCTELEIATDQGMHVDTFLKKLREKGYSNFSEYFKEKRQPGLISLRRKQHEKAMSGNTTMLIWLGKNWLNQTDKLEEKVEETGPTKIIYEIAYPDED